MHDVRIEGDGIALPGLLAVPDQASGLVIFAHGSGSGRLSPRNRQVAAALNHAGFGTLLFDLLLEGEARDRRKVFDVELLAGRLLLAATWARKQGRLRALPRGYFGASTGAAAALIAAAQPNAEVGAVVSRGGRPDLAMDWLEAVDAPTLLIVGGLDEPVIELNARAAARLRRCEMKIIPGATHLFEEPGTLDEVCRHAERWFLRHLPEGVPS